MLRRILRASCENWRPDSIKNNWVSDTGRRIHLLDDLSICVSSLEDFYMRQLAIQALIPFGIVIKMDLLMHEPMWSLGSVIPYFRDRDTSIFGKSLERGSHIERRVHDYDIQRINSQYRLHVPYFFLKTIKNINRYGLEMSDILQNDGNPVWIDMMVHKLHCGWGLFYGTSENVHELVSILKLYLQGLPGGLLTKELQNCFFKAGLITCEGTLKTVLRLLIQTLPRANREALYLLMSVLKQVAMSPENELCSYDIANIFRSVLFIGHHTKWRTYDAEMNVIEMMVAHFVDLFVLQADTLNNIYIQMAAYHPTKLTSIIERRINQHIWQINNIPKKLIILRHNRRSFEVYDPEAFSRSENQGNRFVTTLFNRTVEALHLRRRREDRESIRLKKLLLGDKRVYPRLRSERFRHYQYPPMDDIEERAEFFPCIHVPPNQFLELTPFSYDRRSSL